MHEGFRIDSVVGHSFVVYGFPVVLEGLFELVLEYMEQSLLILLPCLRALDSKESIRAANADSSRPPYEIVELGLLQQCAPV